MGADRHDLFLRHPLRELGGPPARGIRGGDEVLDFIEAGLRPPAEDEGTR
ncbi:MAG: hypothetical protein U5L11_06350 [Arhodomonas sp.]|nr:hypothetical protein [Arhodomonas sp.]